MVAALGITADLWASGRRPVARSDFAEVTRGGVVEQLTTGAKSVLENDFDSEGDRLIAVLSENVKHGVLELRQDGSFTYQHDGDNSDSDTFKYRAFDGTKFSRSARVTISVEDVPNSPPVVIDEVPDQSAIAGGFYELQVASNFADPDEGDELSFSVRGLPKGNSLSIDSASGVLSGTPVNSDVRTEPYAVEVTATDRAGASASLTFQLLIFRDNRADLALTISLAQNPVSVGETAQWNIRIENRGPGDLDDGQYLLRVKAANSSGVWNEAGFTMPVRVTPAPWDTWWAYMGYLAMAVLFGVFLWLGHKRKIRREEEYSDRLEMQVSLRTGEIVERNLQLKNLNTELQESSLSDPLTGLRNRRFVFEEVSKEVAVIQRRHDATQRGIKPDDAADLVFMMIDLDNFKPINDTYGHAAGDQILLEVRDLLLGTCRKSDFVIRWGGDEFVVIAKGSNPGEVEILAERIRSTVADHLFSAVNRQFCHLLHRGDLF